MNVTRREIKLRKSKNSPKGEFSKLSKSEQKKLLIESTLNSNNKNASNHYKNITKPKADRIKELKDSGFKGRIKP